MRFFISLFLSLAVLLPSCTPRLTPLSQRRGDGSRSGTDGTDTPGNPGFITSGDEDGDPEGVSPAVFVCGVEHPDTDSAKIVVLRESLLMLALTPDIQSGIGLDPDTHFLFSDSLYTTTSYADHTIVALGGKPLFSYEGREYIVGLIPSRRGLWTLGNNRSGEGFAMRLNGEAVFKSGSGKARDLHMDGDNAYCIYASSVGAESLVTLVQEGTSHGMTPRYGLSVIDARVSGGELWMLEKGEDGWIVSTSEERFDYAFVPPFQFRMGRLYTGPDGRCTAVISTVAPGYGMPVEIICSEGESFITGGGGGSIYHYFEGSIPYRLCYDKQCTHLSISTGMKELAALDSVVVSNRSAAAALGDHMVVACYPAAGGEAFLWHNGNINGLGFEGYPTGVSINPPK